MTEARIGPFSTLYVSIGEGKYRAIQLYCASCDCELDGESGTGPQARMNFDRVWCPQCKMMLEGEKALEERDAALAGVSNIIIARWKSDKGGQ